MKPANIFRVVFTIQASYKLIISHQSNSEQATITWQICFIWQRGIQLFQWKPQKHFLEKSLYHHDKSCFQCESFPCELYEYSFLDVFSNYDWIIDRVRNFWKLNNPVMCSNENYFNSLLLSLHCGKFESAFEYWNRFKFVLGDTMRTIRIDEPRIEKQSRDWQFEKFIASVNKEVLSKTASKKISKSLIRFIFHTLLGKSSWYQTRKNFKFLFK